MSLCFLVFQSLLDAHDQVACKDFLPRLPDIPHEVDEDDGLCVKIVQLVKGQSEPLVSIQYMLLNLSRYHKHARN